jgi:hypothetical protein
VHRYTAPMEIDLLDRAFVAEIPVIIKARPPEASGRRIVDVEVSNETVDLDGDVVLQDALLKAAPAFVASGHLDIDHLSEFGARLGIPDPSSYIVGRPLDVRAEKGGSTFVEGEISKSLGGQVDVTRNRYDEFWMSLQRDPPVTWFSSIYGFPTEMDDCTKGVCGPNGATRYVVKSIQWRSLAFTRTPKNTALKSAARVVMAKAYLAELAKSLPTIELPGDMEAVWKGRECPNCQVHQLPSLLGYRMHFAKCQHYPLGKAEIMAHAVMYKHRMNRALPRSGG